MTIEINSLNKALKVFRTYNRLSQAALAEKLGVSKSFISEIESGKRTVTLKLVDKYSDIFGVASSEILVLAEAYEDRSVRRSPSDLILKVIDWISTDISDDLHLSEDIKSKSENLNEARI